MQKSLPNNIWAYAIVTWFALFISAIIVFISFAVKNPMSLVSENYYEEELAYQLRMEESSRGLALEGLEVNYDAQENEISIQLPPQHRTGSTKGQVKLYRPSDSRLDKEFALASGPDGVQRLDTSSLRSGLWKVQLDWKANEETYFHETTIVTSSPR